MEDLPGSSLRTTVVHKTLKILPRGVNLCRRNAASMIALESAEWFDLQHNFLFRTEGQSTPSLLEYGVKQRDLHDNGRNTIKGGSRETKGQKSTGGGRTGYGKWEIVTPPCAPSLPSVFGQLTPQTISPPTTSSQPYCDIMCQNVRSVGVRGYCESYV